MLSFAAAYAPKFVLHNTSLSSQPLSADGQLRKPCFLPPSAAKVLSVHCIATSYLQLRVLYAEAEALAG